MKANDLMVGDYISVKPSGMPIKVAAVHHKKVAYHAVVNKLAWVRESLLEPIPLTPEILEKNGFVKNRGVTSWKFETDREDLIDIYGVNDYHLSINIEDTYGSGKGYRWMLNNLTIFYVHELQHALKLCIIDKTIEL